MALKDITRDNSRYVGLDNVDKQLEPSVRNLLEQIAKIDPGEVAGIVVAVVNRDPEGSNLIGLVGPLNKLMQCGSEVVMRIEQLRQRPKDLSKAVDDDVLDESEGR